jgi:pimeloyl-[acyl-carrier protein] methyl ester esterase
MNASAPRIHIEAVGGGPPLLLLHGWAMHGGLFAPILPALAQTHRVHVADLPGHGYSAPLSPLTLDGIVAALDAALADEDEPLTLVGWSLGGALALHWSASRPHRVGKLVLVSTTPAFVVRDDWPHALTRDTLRMFGDELRIAYRQTLQRFLTLQVQGSESGRVALGLLRHQLFARGEPTPGVLAESLALLEAIDLRSIVPRIRTPALVITGGRDALAPPEAGAWLARALPDARLAEFAGAAHAPFLSHRDAFVAVVAEFLDAR